VAGAIGDTAIAVTVDVRADAEVQAMLEKTRPSADWTFW
jgi:hypothetical protein